VEKIRWYIDGNISRTKVQVGGTYKLQEDFEPSKVEMSVRIPGKGNIPTEIDILCDGVSIFNTRPSINNYDTEKTWTTIPMNTLRAGSTLRLDITQTSNDDSCHDLTVELISN
jgi:hypothetical protein